MNPIKDIFQMDVTPCKSKKYVSYTSSLCVGLVYTALQNWYISMNKGPKIITLLIIPQHRNFLKHIMSAYENMADIIIICNSKLLHTYIHIAVSYKIWS
jgi:hypothetical protein